MTDMDKKQDKLRRTVKGTSIAVKVVLVLCGIALLGFFGWLGVQIYTWLGV